MADKASPDVLPDRSVLTDSTRCPSCGTRLSAMPCPGCGLDLTGPLAARVWYLSNQVARLLDQRDAAIATLRSQSAAARPPAPPAPTSPPATTFPAARPPVSPRPRPPAPPPAASPPPARPARTVGMHDLLLGLGAFLLAVAAIGFLVFSWSVLDLAGRAVVIAGCTVGVLAVAGWLRPRLAETAEAVGALGVVLVVGDAWAVRSTGLLGANRPDGLVYAAAAAAGCAAVVGAWGAAARLRAGSVAAALLAPAGVVLAGAAVADATDDAAPFAAGLVATALLAAVRATLPRAWNAERVLLRLTAGGALALAASLAVPSLGMAAGPATAVLVLAAAVALLQAPADLEPGTRAPIESLTHRRIWSAGGGVLAGAVSVPAAWWLVDGTGAGGRWMVAAVPVGAGLALAAAAATRSAPGGVRPFAVTCGTAAVAALAALPAALTGLHVVAHAALLALRPWRVDATEAIGSAGDVATVTTGTWLPGAVGLIVAATSAALGAGLLRRRARRRSLTDRLVAAAAAAAMLAALVLPLAPRLTVAASVGLVTAVAVGLAVLAAWPPPRLRHAGIARPLAAGSAAAGTLATLVAWSTRPLSVPVTVLAIAGLLLARRAAGGVAARAGLVAVAAGATVLVAGAVPGLVDRGTTAADRLAVAATVGTLLAAALVVLPRPGWSPAERLAGAAAAVVAAVPGLAAGLHAAATGGGHWRAELQLVAMLAAVLAACAAARADVVAVADVRAPAAGLVAPIVAALALVGAGDLRADPVPGTVLAAAVFAVAVPLSVLVLVGRVREGSRRVAAESTTALVGAFALLAAVGGGGAERVADRLWITLLLLGAAAAAVAAAPDRRRAGWPAGVLLTGSSWARLALADVESVEAYTLPPAAALLVVAVLRLRARDAAPERVLAPAFGLAVVPSVLAGATGGALRPALLIAAGGALVAAVAWPAAARLHRALLVGGCLAAVGAAAARIAAALWDGAGAGLPLEAIETWSLAAAAVVVAAAGIRRRVRAEADLLVALALTTLLAPSLLAVLVPAADGGGPGELGPWRAAVALAAAAATSLVLSATDPARPPSPGVAARVAVAGAVAATLTGLATGVTRYSEVWTVPLAALLLTVGAVRLARSDAGSWTALGAGLAVLLLPSLLLAFGEGDNLGGGDNNVRSPALAILAGATVATGAMRRLQAPLLFGAGVLAVHAARRLAPYVADVDLPPWAVLAAVGLVLLVLGATYERRIRQLRRARLRIASMR